MNRVRFSLALLLLCSACVRDTQTQSPAQTQAPAQPPTSRPAEPPASEISKAPPSVEAPELASDPEPGTEKGARQFVTNFLRARIVRDERLARTHLSQNAAEQFERGEGGLALNAIPSQGNWEFLSVEAADASSYEIKVRIREKAAGQDAGATFTETFFVGPGPDLQGQQRPWVIRGAMRGDGSSR